MMRKLYERIICKDGFSMSVQANEGAYCTPRKNSQPEYASVEVGFPSSREDLIMEYAEDPKDPTETVYGWVPAEVIRKVIVKHGGISTGEHPPLSANQ
jgi:hypothetical protein